MFTVYARNIQNTIPGRTIADGEEIELFSIPNTRGEDLPFLSASITTELGNAGSFEFSVHTKSIYADIWKHMRSLVRVTYDGETIFYGRVLTRDRDMFRTRKIHCEGAYTFFNDSVFEGKKSGYTVAMSVYLQALIDMHNSCMAQFPEKQIFLGEVPGNYSSSVSDAQKIKDDTQKFAASNGYKEVKGWLDELVQDYGGHMRVRYNDDDGKLYLDWMKLYFNQNENNQSMTVSSNVVDLSDTVEVNNIFTHVIPLGKNGKFIGGSSSGSGSGSSNKHSITVVPAPVPEGGGFIGYVAANTSAAVKGLKITLTVQDLNGWHFDHWTATTTSTGTAITVTNGTFDMPDEDVLVVGYFVNEPPDDDDPGIQIGEETHHITVRTTPSNGGTASASATDAYQSRRIRLKKEAASGFTFDHWSVMSGNVTINESDMFNMGSEDVIIYACFTGSPEPTPTSDYHSITVNSVPSAGGSVAASKAIAKSGTVIKLRQIPNDGYTFSSWIVVSGGVTVSSNQFTMGNQDVVINASYNTQ